MVGDTTIVMNRSLYVDFTLPYTESGVQMVVPMKENWSKSFWIFVKPIENVLWAVILAVFVATGFVVWLVEHKRNRHFGGNAAQQFFNISYFSFQAIIATPRDQKLKKWLSKFVLINLLLLVWLLEKLYSASLTSMMTARQLQPTIVDMNQLMRNGDYVGYRGGSFVKDLLTSLKFEEHKIRKYSSPDQFAEALMKGSGNGGVVAIFDEIPYLKLFMSKHCSNHSVVGRVYKTGGFGFVFPKGSPLVADISRAILKVTEGDMIVGIERKWFGDQVACDSQRNVLGSAAVITLSNLRGVFLITAGAWALALIIWAVIWFRQRRRGHDTQQSYDALAELAVEHVDAVSRDPDERVVWTIGRDSHLVLHLLGNPPPQPAPSDEEPEPEQQPPAVLGKAGEEPEMPLQEVPDGEGGEFRR